ncbi:hypothetical protein V2G26_010718 [Clonostachys chloroleuca]
MPGTPYSRGCQVCKRRKIKCDEVWPTCTPCKRTHHTCPGPSALFKFVHEGLVVAVDARRRRKSPVTNASQLQLQLQQRLESGDPHAWRPATSVNWNPIRSYGDKIGSYAVFRMQAPQYALTSEADSIATRLILIMEQDSNGSSGVRMQMGYLPYLPMRLSRSESLRNCAALFCSAWEEYLRYEDSRELLTFGLYSRAIHSVQAAIAEESPYSVETLAAMILLERTGTLFGTDQVTNLEAQYRGIEWVLTRKGTLNFSDPFDVTLAFESQHILHTASLNGSRGYLAEAHWMNLMETVAGEYLAMDELKCFPSETFILNRSLGRLAQFNAEVRTIRMNPSENKELSASVLCSLSDLERPIATLIHTTTEAALAAGDIIDELDATSVLGHSFHFRSPFFAHVLAGGIMFQILLLRMIYDLGVVYGQPDAAVYSRYRDACARFWLYIPYIAKLDAMSAVNLLGPVLLSLEGANKAEKAVLLSQVLAVKCYKPRYPGGEKQLEAMAISFAMHRTGRIPDVHGGG